MQAVWTSLLMSVLVPRCYAQFLSSLSQLTPSLSYWPRARVTLGTITSWDTCANKTGERMLTSSEARLYTMTGRSVCPARERDKIWILTSGEDTLKHILKSFVKTDIIDLSSEDAHNVLTHLETNGFQDRIIRQDNIQQICLENFTVIDSMDTTTDPSPGSQGAEPPPSPGPRDEAGAADEGTRPRTRQISGDTSSAGSSYCLQRGW